jgi:excinuclease ABC subunit B
MAYNKAHGITPTQIRKALTERKVDYVGKAYIEPDFQKVAEDPIVNRMDREQLSASIEHTRKLMAKAAKDLNFELAIQYREELLRLEEIYNEKKE